MKEITKRDALLLSAMGLFALASWLLAFAWFLARLFVAAAIGWGLIGSFEPFPYETVRSWQEAVSSATLMTAGMTAPDADTLLPDFGVAAADFAPAQEAEPADAGANSLESFGLTAADFQEPVSSETLSIPSAPADEIPLPGGPHFPGAQLFLWCAGEWFEIAILVLLLNSMHARRVLQDVGPTSHHAAFAASALANYLSINPTTPRLLGMDKKSGSWRVF